MSDVIGLDWLRMFSSKELSTLISGAEHEISVSDLQAHTNYAGGYELNHPTITAFWQVVMGFDEEQKRSLLKFVTSCSRPPLLGFKVIFMSPSYSIIKYSFRIWIPLFAFRMLGQSKRGFQQLPPV